MSAVAKKSVKIGSVATSVERILTLHPAGKNGVRIDRAKYDEMRKALLKAITRSGEGTGFRELPALVKPLLRKSVFGPGDSVHWYVVVVKQDLEARGEIVQLPGVKPQRLQKSAARR